NMQTLRAGVNRNGPWHLLVEKDGVYEFELRRWPKEADAPIAGGVPAFQAVDGGLPEGKALPIAQVRWSIGAAGGKLPVGPQDKAGRFTVPLKAGQTLLRTWGSGAGRHRPGGAYFG